MQSTKRRTSKLAELGIPLTLEPMEALRVAELPKDPGWVFEPKWDGFRCLAFRAANEVEIRAKSGRSLTRFFPEVLDNIRALPTKQFVLDGELVIPVNGQLSFDALQMRLHPADSRIRRLARETPATFVAFDCLLRKARVPLLQRPFEQRRESLVALLAREQQGISLTPSTHNPGKAETWLARPQLALDGVIAKRLDMPYMAGNRAMLKVKRLRAADCVVGGFRYASKGPLVASLLLGLYDNAGVLHHVGFTSAISNKDRPRLTARLETLIEPPGFTGNAPGGPSRWSTERSAAWEPLRPTLVVEVRYDHVTDHRFRHGTKLVRWRPDKSPRQCTFGQLAKPSTALASL